MAERKTSSASAKAKRPVVTPPPAKKAKQLVQARLPFSVIDKSNPPSSSAQKKRKLSDTSAKSVAQKGPKLAKNDENVVVIDGDSNDETPHGTKTEAGASKNIMHKFFVKLGPEDKLKTADSSEVQVIEKTPEKKLQLPAAETPDTISLSSISDSGTPVSKETARNSESCPNTPGDVNDSSDKESDAESSPTVVNKNKTPDSIKRMESRRLQSQKERLEKDRIRKELKEKKEMEKKLAKEQKEKERLLEKEKKEKERLEIKQKKEQERIEKEKEREEKRKQLEDEKRKKIEQKEEEKRKKQELIDAKNAERKIKEEEKRKAGENKKKQENEKSKIQQKQKAIFTQFFQKSSPISSGAEVESNPSLFFAFEKKKDMYLAPHVRATMPPARLENLDERMEEQNTSALYIQELKEGRATGKSTQTCPKNCDVEIIEPDSKATLMKTKLLQFHENYRPAYYGTWRKKSSAIKPRLPFVQDKALFDYEVESDDEWEEEEPGESLSNSEGEGEDEDGKEADPAGDDEEDDGFFVPHGYLSEGEGCEEDEEDDTPERLKARQQARARAFETEMKQMQKCELLKPKYVGCCWFNPNEEGDCPEVRLLLEYKAVNLLDTPFISLDVKASAVSVKESNKESAVKEKKGPKLMAVPDEAIPELIRLVHGNSCSIQKLIKEFREYWHRKMLGEAVAGPEEDGDACELSVPRTPGGNTPVPMETEAGETPDRAKSGTPNLNDTPNKEYTISKRQLDTKIRKLASYEKRDDYKGCCWYVSQAVLDTHGIKDLPVPTKWNWITRVEKRKTPKPEPAVPCQTPEGKGAQTPTSGRQTPTAPSIKQFTVPNMSPLLFTPVSTKTANAVVERPEVLKPTPVKASPAASATTPSGEATPSSKDKSLLLKMFNSMASKPGTADNSTQGSGDKKPKKKIATNRKKSFSNVNEADVIVLD